MIVDVVASHFARGEQPDAPGRGEQQVQPAVLAALRAAPVGVLAPGVGPGPGR
jgi:hypothetical protein